MTKLVFAAFLIAALGMSASAIVLSEAPYLRDTAFTHAGAADLATPLKITVSLSRANSAVMDKTLNDVSNPKSDRYGQYLTTEQAMAMTRPSKQAVESVEAWLRENDVAFTQSAMGHTITLQTNVEQASKLFGAVFSNVVNSETEQTAVIGDAVSIPDALAEHIEAVFGVHGLPLPPRKDQVSAAGTPADVTPDVINKTYKIGGVKVARDSKNRVGVVEFQGQLMSQKDLSTFFTKYVSGAQAGDDKVFKYVSDQKQGEGVEANLDVQFVMGVAVGVKTEMWQYANTDFCADVKTWTTAVLAESAPPTVFTVSYGYQGKLTALGCSTAQIDSIDNDFKSMSAAGISIIFASGDSGSGQTGGFLRKAQLYASWPASSLYVTAVGATRFQGQTVGNAEQATDQFGSGGGFSRLVKQPTWQNDAVTKFYSEDKNAPAATMYGKGGRGTPDVAALGEGFQVIMSGRPQSVGGTSAAAPTFAGVVALLNQARQAAGKSSLGLLNQWIYQNPDMFTDVTVGSDRVSRSGSTVKNGFDCEAGWDPVTGWGTPNFPAMLKAALAK